ncbi:hypothetical protein [Arthrobacter sp. M4]|uniref:hypothetical protein n=1 Tax=Arthrobacter sp. M4 TaxID=218160 RepID=UPI001CDBFD2C|nr:hypothetical protein [Arthrobacter sp. M4]MCA4132593.1 hypothetical protein [Arthrobacter sp. M4]
MAQEPGIEDHVESCAFLSRDDRIEARFDQSIHFIGIVEELMPEMNLFWAVSDYGERRIVEFDEYSVRRLSERAEKPRWYKLRSPHDVGNNC